MEVLENALFLDQVPPIWTARAYPSLLGLTSWFSDLTMRLRELETWSTDFVVKLFRTHRNACKIMCPPSHYNIKIIAAAIMRLAGRFFQSAIVAHGDHAKHSAT